jgi:hypothetical protein
VKKRIFALLFALTVPAFADEPLPKCEGKDKSAAQHARSNGLQHYRASRRSGAGDPEMTSALGFFDAACAAGDDTALELRAYALAGLDRYVEAAKSLDAFLASHPLDTLPDDVKARVEAQAPEILRHVASLTVTSKPDGAKVTLNHRALGTTPLKDVRLAPGTYDIEVQSDAGTQKRTTELAEGKHDEAFDFSPKTDETPPPPPPPPAKEKPKSSLMPLVITTGVLAVGAAAVGVIGGVWSSGSASSYNDKMCGLRMKPAGCDGILSDVNTGFTLEVLGFIGAGVFGAATAVLFVMEATKGKPKTEGLRCAPTLGGGVCAIRF